MKYVYPKFPEVDLFFFRLGGCGLGNLLFIYSRALIFAKENNYRLIWPTWPSIKVGPIIRCENDKRFYNNLFVNKSNYVSGINKLKLMLNQRSNMITVFDKKSCIMSFKDMINYKKLIFDDIVNNINDKNSFVFNFDFSNALCAHIRLGDFQNPNEKLINTNANNISTPIDWYIVKIREIRSIINKCIPVFIFTDGNPNQLCELSSLDNVHIYDKENSIVNILALSKAKLLLASGSSTSMWARFLGRVPTIAYRNQLKEHIYDNILEVECDYNSFSDDIAKKIKNLYR